MITNSHLCDSQLDYLNQVDRLWSYQSQGKSLLMEVTQQYKMHDKAEAALQQVSCFQKVNPIPPPGIAKLGKYEIINYRYTIESKKFEADAVKSSLENVGDLIEGVWNTCSNVLFEWGIGEIEESLETLTPKIEAVEQERAASEEEIQDLAVLNSKAMHFSMVSPVKIYAQVDENARISKRGIKEIASLTIQDHLRAQLTK